MKPEREAGMREQSAINEIEQRAWDSETIRFRHSKRDAFKSVLREAYRAGAESRWIPEDTQKFIEKRARQLMLEHYDADLYKRALEDHMKVCTRPILIALPDPPKEKPE